MISPDRAILAHGSGIDDVLWFVVPVVAVFTWLRVAERRARKRAEDAESDQIGTTDDVD